MIEVPAGVLYRIVDTALNALNQKAVNSTNEKVSELARDAMCDFQLYYSNYQFNSSRLHKTFKESKEETSGDTGQNFSRLTDLAESGMKLLCGRQAKLIRRYFDVTHRHPIKPRVGIHLCDDENVIKNLVMLPTLGQKQTDKKVDDYTVFTKVLTTGLPYLNNHLPQEIIDTIKSGQSFKHKGIDVNSIAKLYSPKFADKKIPARFRNNFFNKSTRDIEWNKICGLPETLTDGISSMYKSHLVVPITFRGHMDENQLDQSLVDILCLSEESRSILGFICIDHPTTHYFDERDVVSFKNIDVNILYMFADMISLIMIIKLMYTTGSTTYTDYQASQ